MTNDLKYIVSKETVTARRWGSLTQKNLVSNQLIELKTS